MNNQIILYISIAAIITSAGSVSYTVVANNDMENNTTRNLGTNDKGLEIDYTITTKNMLKVEKQMSKLASDFIEYEIKANKEYLRLSQELMEHANNLDLDQYDIVIEKITEKETELFKTHDEYLRKLQALNTEYFSLLEKYEEWLDGKK